MLQGGSSKRSKGLTKVIEHVFKRNAKIAQKWRFELKDCEQCLLFTGMADFRESKDYTQTIKSGIIPVFHKYQYDTTSGPTIKSGITLLENVHPLLLVLPLASKPVITGNTTNTHRANKMSLQCHVS